MHTETVIRPQGTMGRREFADALGVPETTVRAWVSGGVLDGLPGRMPGEYTTADAAVGRLVLQLQRLLGRKSEMAASYARQLAPRVWNTVVRGETARFVAELRGTGITVFIDISVLADGSVLVAA